MRNRHVIAIVVMTVGGLIALATAAGAAVDPEPVQRHCVVEVTGVRDGVFVTLPDVCFDTEEEAAAYAATIGVGPTGLDRFAGSSTIGTHYTSTGFNGSSVRIAGASCTGGVWYATGTWNNNLESSRHYCGAGATRFYDSSSCSGSPYAIYGQKTSLGSMNNRASCVRYG